MRRNFYVERGESAPHLPISELTGELLLSSRKATPLHQEGSMVVLRLTKDFWQKAVAHAV